MLAWIRFQFWVRSVKNIGRGYGWTEFALRSIDRGAWRKEYFNAGMSPADAWREEHSYGE